jgi:hypothetical protein
MAYGHAERTLATIRLLEAETRDLLSRREHLDQEQAEWLRDTAESASCQGPSVVTLGTMVREFAGQVGRRSRTAGSAHVRG